MRKLYSRPNADIVIYDNLDSVLKLSGVDTQSSGYNLTSTEGKSYTSLRS
jgi:hypothetical protein